MSHVQLATEDSTTAPLILEEFHDDPTVDEVSNRISIDDHHEPANALKSYTTPVQTAADKIPSVGQDFPEGGVKAWCTVAGSFLVFSVTQGSIQSFGVYQDFYTRNFLSEHTPSQIAWIGSMQIFFIYAVAIFSGKFFDDGYFRELLAFGSLLYLFSYFMLSLAKPHHFYEVFLSQGIGVGLAMGIMHNPCSSVCFQYFRRKKALAAGVFSTGVAFGGIVQSIGLNLLINGKVGFAWGVRIYGLIFFVSLLIANLLMRPRFPPKRQRPGAGQPPKPNFGAVFQDYAYLTLTLAISLVFFGLFFPFFFVQLFAVLKGVSQNFAFYSLTILNGASIPGRLIPGLIADKYGTVNTLIVVMFCCGVLLFAMLGAGSVGGLIAFTILYGFFSGACFSLSLACVPAYIDNPSEFGVRFGFALSVISIFVLISNPIAGAIIDAPHYFWTRAVIFEGVIFMAGVVMMIISRQLLIKRKKTWRL